MKSLIGEKMEDDRILVVERATKMFGGLTALKDLNISVRRGTIHSVIGPNGAGKTTFFNCIMQAVAISSGRIWFEKERIDGLSPDLVAKLGINRTYQNIRLFRNVSAAQNLLVGMHLHLRSSWLGALFNTRFSRDDEAAGYAEAARLLDFVGLAKRGDILAKDLAYGEQRRLEIGRALAARPTLLMLDEPTAGMNPREMQDMLAFIRQLRDELGLTILLIEHQMSLVMSLSDRITVLDHGVVLAEGGAAEIRSHPGVIEAYLGRGSGRHRIHKATSQLFQGAPHGTA